MTLADRSHKLVQAVIALHVGLLIFDKLPFPLVLFGIASHLVYLQNFGALWPYIQLTSPSFIVSCILVVADHFLWFHHFSARLHDARRYQNTYHRPHTPRVPTESPTLAEVASFFGVCIWLVPLFLFLSLSANDNALPTLSGGASRPGTPMPDQTHHSTGSVSGSRTKVPRVSLFKYTFDAVLDLIPSRFRRRGRTQNDGLIAPHSPRPESPVPGGIPRRTSAYGFTGIASGTDFKLAPPPAGPRRVSTDEGISRLSPRTRPVALGVDDDFRVGAARPPSPLRQMST